MNIIKCRTTAWEDNISVGVAISIVNRDKESSWHELLEDYLGEGEENEV